MRQSLSEILSLTVEELLHNERVVGCYSKLSMPLLQGGRDEFALSTASLTAKYKPKFCYEKYTMVNII